MQGRYQSAADSAGRNPAAPVGSSTEIPFHEMKRRSDRANSQPSKFSSPKNDFEDHMIIHERKANVSPFRLIVSTELTSEPAIACPVCGDSWVHLRDVTSQMNHTRVHCHGDDCDVTRTTAGSPDRGSSVMIRFAGECGHQFAYTMKFHKGITYLTLHDVAEFSQSQWPSCLWRD